MVYDKSNQCNDNVIGTKIQTQFHVILFIFQVNVIAM